MDCDTLFPFMYDTRYAVGSSNSPFTFGRAAPCRVGMFEHSDTSRLPQANTTLYLSNCVPRVYYDVRYMHDGGSLL